MTINLSKGKKSQGKNKNDMFNESFNSLKQSEITENLDKLID